VGRMLPDVAGAICCTEDQVVDAGALHTYGINGEAGAYRSTMTRGSTSCRARPWRWRRGTSAKPAAATRD
jgi:hypothetical protein